MDRRSGAPAAAVRPGRRPPPATRRGDTIPRGSASSSGGRASAKTSRAARSEPKTGVKKVAAFISGASPRAAIIIALFVLFVVLSVSPVSRNLEARSRLNRLADELKNQKAVTESLKKDVAEAGTLDYVEKEARKQRLVAPGEILYLVTTDSSENEVKYRVKAIQSKEEAWARVRQMLHSVPRGQ